MRHELALASLAISLALGAPRVQAQAAPNPDAFRNGVQYTFERTFATRRVHDEFDRGRISLATYIWRPMANARHQVVLFSHGSLGGMTIDPHEPVLYIPADLLKYFVKHGYTVVMATRRGLGDSTGTFREECAFAAGKCTIEEYRGLAKPGLAEAVADMNAVIDQVVLREAQGSKIVLAGISRGGFLALRMAAERPDITAGVVNFVGGWLSVTDTWSADENAARMTLQSELFRDAGARSKGVPTLWIYASRDPFYPENTTRAFFAAFTAGGGVGRYVFVPEHKLPSGHGVGGQPDLWSADVEPFLAGLHSSQ